VSGGRVIAGLGAGDSQSRAENEAYGLEFGTLDDRLAQLRAAVVATRARGLPVWVGGAVRRVGAIAALADGWNAWGLGPEELAPEIAELREAAPGAAVTWGGVARPREEGAAALADRLARYAELGCTWAVVACADPLDPVNAEVIADARRRLA
jgi:alkanesulfonate monooxygenase SsuD/methylene tetrahydromethanopterin reductase-like flavin-dependent oxidoreductase (luciferase family)